MGVGERQLPPLTTPSSYAYARHRPVCTDSSMLLATPGAIMPRRVKTDICLLTRYAAVVLVDLNPGEISCAYFNILLILFDWSGQRPRIVISGSIL